MNSFLELPHALVNISKIKTIREGRNDNSITIAFDDGDAETYDIYGNIDIVVGKAVVQLIPCAAPMYNIFKNEDGSYFHERVCSLALCLDGIIRSISGGEYFEFADDAKNFVGCYGEDSLTDFPISKD